ncbi:MAG: ATP-grasp domain-containing protein [Candidatus Margulisbacteria bacterium]|nr:ATP-grasp domain-containing protein [Candidatus Margulisiibacteriota bacterium]
MNKKASVLVVGSHVSGLAVIRALGAKGIKPVALSYEKSDFGNVSKYVSEKVTIPHPRLEEENFIDFLIGNVHRWKDALIIDTDDNGAVTISKHKHELLDYYKVATAEWELLKNFLEKKEAHKLALECNVPHPKNFLPKTIVDLDEIKDHINYPVILKPVRGHEFYSKFHIKNFEVNTYEELLSKFRLCIDENQEVMLQEIIVGPETNLYKMQTYINSKGLLSAKFFWNKIRQHPPMFGVGRVGISSERNEEVEHLSQKLIEHSKYKGYFSIEFKKDLRDDQLKLMEVNVRMPRNGMLAVASGVNFPWIIYKDLAEDEQIIIDDYIKNFYYIEIGLDLYNAIFHHKKEKFKIKDYILPYLSKNKVFAIFSLSDIKPFIKLLLLLFSKFLFRIRVIKREN